MINGHRRVSLLGTGSFLPGDPVPSNQIDQVLGPLDNAPERVKSFMQNVGARLLRDGGVEHRHFAVDPKTHNLTHTLASLAEEAARRALDAAAMTPNDIDFLLFSSPSYDQTTPPTSTILQERLGMERCAEMEVHSNCSGVGKCVQIAYDSLRMGRYKTALVTYAQLSSVYLRDCYYNQPQMTKTQAALRYILADGSGALVLKAVDAGGNGASVPHELLGTYVESVGGKRPAGMTAGGGVADLIDAASPAFEVLNKGKHHLDQDFSAVNRSAVDLLLDGTTRMLDLLGLAKNDIDHYVYSIPTKQLYDGNCEKVTATLGVGLDRVQFRARECGYCGGASILVHFDQMVRANEIKPGQLVLLHSVESSKWMSAGFVVKW
jgi:3-oxoacyl-[acyl-carrier-protein] synthase-3